MRLEIEHLSKTYPGGVRALDDVSLSIEPGMFGLLGPNGAGKSTLMRTIATLQLPDQGSIRVFLPVDNLCWKWCSTNLSTARRTATKLASALRFAPQPRVLHRIDVTPASHGRPDAAYALSRFAYASRAAPRMRTLRPRRSRSST